MQEIVIQIGPLHPSLNEPAGLMLTLEGEKVVNANLRIGYNHRGLEKLCESKTYDQNVFVIERLNGVCPQSQSMVYCQAVEKLCDITISRRAAYIRVIVAELERLQSHLMWLSLLGQAIGFEALFMAAWSDRDKVMSVLSLLGDNRANYAVNILGGVRSNLDRSKADQVVNLLNELEDRLKYYTELLSGDTTLSMRLMWAGKLTREDALKWCAVGPVARASALDNDVRVDDPYAAYDDLIVQPVVGEKGDALCRCTVRAGEMSASIAVIRAALENIPEGPLAMRVPQRIPAGEALARCESPRGETVCYVQAKNEETPARVRIRSASAANLNCLVPLVKGTHLADVPVILSSLDLCFSCVDR